MLRITPDIEIPDSEILVETMHAAGPGGQNVNKVSTAVRVRFDVRNSRALPPAVKRRLEHLARGRITAGGVLLIRAQRQRTREANRRDALERLRDWVLRAAAPPPVRHKTRPPAAADQRRKARKQHRSRLKSLRRPPAIGE